MGKSGGKTQEMTPSTAMAARSDRALEVYAHHAPNLFLPYLARALRHRNPGGKIG